MAATTFAKTCNNGVSKVSCNAPKRILQKVGDLLLALLISIEHLSDSRFRLGLPEELLRALGGDGRGTSEADALAAAEEALWMRERWSGRMRWARGPIWKGGLRNILCLQLQAMASNLRVMASKCVDGLSVDKHYTCRVSHWTGR